MLFSQVIGQASIKQRFIRSVKEERIPHAQLLFGTEGVGKLPLAIAYAQYICCENRKENDSCGVCPSCVKFNKLVHPDLHFVFPIIKPAGKTSVVCDDFIADFRDIVLEKTYFSVDDWYSKISGTTKQGMIYTNESEEIVRKLSMKTYEAEYKIMIIWLPEKMHTTAANKLLKILEEPYEKTLFLLVSNAPDEIITTILSRTQQINIPKLTDEEIIQALLTKNSDIKEEDAYNAARTANGSYLQASNILEDDNENKLNFERFVSIMRLSWQVGNRKDHASLKTLKKWADDMSAASVGRERQKKFLAYAQRMIRENFILNLHQPELNYLTSYEDNFSQKFSPFINERNVEDLVSEFALAERQIEQNVNAKMIFFDLVLKIIMLLKR
ncbi:DNA polymerase III subunit delta [Paludibacter sp. 221]|uniref:DNA polymerase III subunit n=1 Tax=Paludibacter sp. 221 TaxID=2302939 RepID=UPI0013D5C5DB|nr:DNA polymerase III subunit [Paludibacter sp. 221]NDV45921.1 DNA polymerase III subunit delta [Paludibacter sp. 221]